jgi:hypothetical protein
MIVLPDRPPSTGEAPVLANLPEVARYRHPRFIIRASRGAALFILWESWTLTKDASAPSAASAVPVTVSRGPSVAVLPFENTTGDAGQETLAEGLTQGLISALCASSREAQPAPTEDARQMRSTSGEPSASIMP